MQMKKIGIICLIIFILASCTKSYSDKLLGVFYTIQDKSTFDYKYLIIIPNSGCTGCISFAENFFMENKDNQEMFFVFTKIFSKKDLKIRIGRDNLTRSNVYIDDENRLYLSQYEENIYPVVFIFQDKKVGFKYLDDMKFPFAQE
jgi:thioredoxin-related protein